MRSRRIPALSSGPNHLRDPLPVSRGKTGKGTSSLVPTAHPKKETRLQPLRYPSITTLSSWRVLCDEGSLHPYPHPSRLRESSRCPRRFSPTIKNAALSGRAILGIYSTFPCSWDNIESRPHLSRHARVGRTLLSDAFDLDLDFCRCPPRALQSRGRAALQRRVRP
jgi:hypothetical protein